jgi:hypothetical protein
MNNKSQGIEIKALLYGRAYLFCRMSKNNNPVLKNG